MKMENKKIPLLVIVGPTASGKTGLAVELAMRLHGEVVSADSMQVYKQMQIGTAKPDAAEMRGVPHHLIDCIDPDNAAFSVADYAKMAREAIGRIHAAGHLPILVGGTGLYVQAVIDNIQYDPIQNNAGVRERLADEAEREGVQAMWERLQKVDPQLAGKLHPNNLGRVLRALEVYELTGIPMSRHQEQSRREPSDYMLCMLGITFADREHLYARIDRRVDKMLEDGLLDEARAVSASYGGTARQAIGYKELQPFLDGEESLENCIAHLKQATWNYAKRQLTWFRRDPRIHWLEADRYSDLQALYSDAQAIAEKSGILQTV